MGRLEPLLGRIGEGEVGEVFVGAILDVLRLLANTVLARKKGMVSLGR
jgi:hypothetical protein